MKKIIKPEDHPSNTFEENFKIYLRLKPNTTTIEEGKQCIKAIGKKKVQLISPYYSSDSDKIYHYDEALSTETTNQQVFQKTMIVPILNALSGFNSTVFIYGMTGAGKTYTMLGQKIDDGLIGLALEYMFNEINLKSDVKTQVLLSFFEIYNENIRDLLHETAQNLTIMQDPSKGVIINDLKQISIDNQYHGKQLISEGVQRRAMNATKSNELSSRSHAILQLQIKRYVPQGQNISVLESKFFMIDLAGNEKTGYNESKRFIEGVNINKSLLTLGKCINILAQQKKNSFVPFRDSKLTRILKQSLGGNSKTVMIACVSTERKFYQQTLNTLKYSSIAKKIKNKGIKNNVKMISKNELPDPKICIQTEEEHLQQKKIAETLSKLIVAVQDKITIENLKENLQKAKEANINNIKQGFNMQQSKQLLQQIENQIWALNNQYNSTITHAQNLYKTLMGDVIKRRNSGDNLHSKKHINKLQQIIKDQHQKIQQLQGLLQKTNLKQDQNNTFISGSVCPENSYKIDQSMTHTQRSQTNKKSELLLNSFHTNDNNKTMQLQPKENKRILNSQQQITINLKQTSKISHNNSKDDFIKRLKETQKRAKGSNIQDISQIISQQENFQYDLNSVEQSMLRKLKFFQRERPMHKSQSMGSKQAFLRNNSNRKWTQKL